MKPFPSNSNACRRISTWIAGVFCLNVALCVSGCGESPPQPLNVGSDNVAALDPGAAFILPANTKLEALGKCEISFPGTDLFEPGEIIGEVVDIDDDALMRLAPHNEKVTVYLKRGQSMLITKARTITVDQTDTTPCRFKVTQPDG